MRLIHEFDSLPPETLRGAHRVRRAIAAPIERFLSIQAASGIVLLLAAAIALAWANSPWADHYVQLRKLPLGVTLGPLSFRWPLYFWVNDVLMTIFFFVVGLEIKRELMQGELSELRRAALPVAAALGGMVAPALIYGLANDGLAGSSGWAVPVATDIAFAVGVFALLGTRVPAALRVLLLALAVIDDVGAIVIIGVFYTAEVAPEGLLWIAGGLGLTAILTRSGLRRELFYVPAGAMVWFGMLRFGVHPTLAGVLLGLMTPHRRWFSSEEFLGETRRCLDVHDHTSESALERRRDQIDRMVMLGRESQSPLERLQLSLHGVVAFVIMPLFALMNAGMALTAVSLDSLAAQRTALGTMVGLVLGKPLGVMLAATVVIKLGVAKLPRGVRLRDVLVVGAVAGVGFTMSIFIAELAFAGSPLLATAKLAIIAASTVAALVALSMGAVILPREPSARVSAQQAERATEL